MSHSNTFNTFKHSTHSRVSCKASYKAKKDTKGEGRTSSPPTTTCHSGPPAKKYVTLKSHLLLQTRKAELPAKKPIEQTKVNKKLAGHPKPLAVNNSLSTNTSSAPHSGFNLDLAGLLKS